MNLELLTEMFSHNLNRLVKEATAAQRRAERRAVATARFTRHPSLRRMPL